MPMSIGLQSLRLSLARLSGWPLTQLSSTWYREIIWWSREIRGSAVYSCVALTRYCRSFPRSTLLSVYAAALKALSPSEVSPASRPIASDSYEPEFGIVSSSNPVTVSVWIGTCPLYMTPPEAFWMRREAKSSDGLERSQGRTPKTICWADSKLEWICILLLTIISLLHSWVEI